MYYMWLASSLDVDTADYTTLASTLGVAGLPSALNEECWVLVVSIQSWCDNNIGLVCGQKVVTGGGQYPQSHHHS